MTNTYFISTPSFVSKNTNNAINNLSIHFLETEFYRNDLRVNLEDSLHQYINQFLEKEYIFSHIDEMNISTINDKRYMTYDHYIKSPMPAFEFKLNIILAGNPNLINSFNRSHIHPLIRKYSHIPFNN